MRPSTKKILLILLLVVVVGALVLPHISQAGCTINPSCYIAKLIYGLVKVVNTLLGWLIAIMTSLIIWMIEFGSQIMSLPTVQAGFKVSLSLVNLLFVMGLIVSAFQIILGVDDHHAKERIKNVIIAAILVNFSFLIAGFMLDISNVFTHYFLTHFTTSQIGEAFSLDKLQHLAVPVGRDVDSFSELFAILPIALFSIILTFLVLIIMIAVFATALVRTLYVAVLLTVMPLAWGMWVFPGLSSYSSEWWKNFIKQGVVVLPTITFFIFLTVSTAKGLNTALAQNPAAPTGSTTDWNTILTSLLQMCILGGFLVGGLKISQAAGGVSASAALGAAKTVGGIAARTPGIKAGKRFIERTVAKPASGRMASFASDMAGSDKWYKRAVGKTMMLSGAANAAAGYSHLDHQLEEGMKEEYEGLGTGQRVNAAMGAKTTSGKAKAYLAIKEKGDVGFKTLLKKEGGDVKLKELMDAYGGYTHNNTDELIKSTPTLKKALSGNPEAMARVKTATKMSDPNYDKDYQKNLTSAYLKMDTAGAREIDMKDVVNNPQRLERFGTSLSGNQLAATARKNGENQMFVRYAIIDSLSKQMKPLKGIDADIDSRVTAVNTLNGDLKKAIDDGKQDEIIEISGSISQNMEKLKEKLDNSKDNRFVTARVTADKFEKVDKISGMLTESISGGGDDDKK